MVVPRRSCSFANRSFVATLAAGEADQSHHQPAPPGRGALEDRWSSSAPAGAIETRSGATSSSGPIDTPPAGAKRTLPFQTTFTAQGIRRGGGSVSVATMRSSRRPAASQAMSVCQPSRRMNAANTSRSIPFRNSANTGLREGLRRRAGLATAIDEEAVGPDGEILCREPHAPPQQFACPFVRRHPQAAIVGAKPPALQRVGRRRLQAAQERPQRHRRGLEVDGDEFHAIVGLDEHAGEVRGRGNAKHPYVPLAEGGL